MILVDHMEYEHSTSKVIWIQNTLLPLSAFSVLAITHKKWRKKQKNNVFVSHSKHHCVQVSSDWQATVSQLTYMKHPWFHYHFSPFLHQVMKWVTDFAAEYSSIAEEIVVTKSFEGRDIKAIKVIVSLCILKD